MGDLIAVKRAGTCFIAITLGRVFGSFGLREVFDDLWASHDDLAQKLEGHDI